MSSRVPLLALVGICLLCFFVNLGGNGLFDLDEALYANCAREMVLTGDHVVPRVNGDPFFEKPPLVYWAAAAFYVLLGRNEFTTRLPSALASVAVVALIWRFGRRQLGESAGTLAAFFFALSPMVFGAARQLTMDASLDVWVTISLLAFYHARASGRRAWYLLFWLSMALGVLTKGLPGVLIPVATVVVYAVVARIRARGLVEPASVPAVESGAGTEARPTVGVAFLRLQVLIAGVLIFLAVALPWHLLAYRAAGSAFTSEYIIRQHLARFRGGDTSHLAPFWFFVPAFLVGAFPWGFFVPSAYLSPCHSDGDTRKADLRLFLKVWAALVFVMFSASGSKLISYILPMYPPAALLVGDWSARALEGSEARRTLLWCSGAAVVLSLLLLGVVLFSGPIIHAVEASSHRPVRMDQVPDGALRWAGHLFAAALVAASSFFAFLAMNRRRAAFGAMATGMTLFYAVAVFEGLPLIDRALLRPLRDAARAVIPDPGRAHRALPLVVKTGGARRPSVLFYLPDEMIGKPPRQGGVLETTDPHRVEHFLITRPSEALVDAASAPPIAASTRSQTLYANAGWSLLVRP